MEREEQIEKTARILLRGRKGGAPIEELSEVETPQMQEEAYRIQDRMAQDFGAVGGWKIGAPSATETPFFAPMPAAWMVKPESVLSGPHYRLRGVEAEIAFEIGADLRPSERPYTRDEVIAAISKCAPAIELLEAGLLDPRTAPRLAMFADMQMHGGFIAGPEIKDWQSIDWTKERVTLSVNGKVAVERTASNPGGTDLLRLLTYLANEGSKRTGGLHKGQWITTGSWTGATWLQAGDKAEIHFSTAGDLNVQFA